MSTGVDPAVERGWVDAELAEEFPGLGLWTIRVHARSGRSPQSVRVRLRALAGRITGGHVVHMRQDPVPWAYRVLWRQVGLDPDVNRPPAERAAVERLRAGGLPSRNLLDDALTIAVLETSVPVLAFDAALVGSALGLRPTRAGELLGGSGRPLRARQIVLADEDRPIATLDGEVSEERGVTRATEDMVIAAIQARNVPLISVEEALWTVAEVLALVG
jgi:DNA/RNA-binding domain of Phe-tRNA-synthetase-like protein